MKTLKTAFIEHGGDHIYDSYNYKEWTDHSLTWSLAEHSIENKIIGENCLRSYKDLLGYDAIILDTRVKYSWFMKPLLERNLEDRPLVICYDINSYDLLTNCNKNDNFEWLSNVDIMSFWSYYGRSLYEPKEEMHLCKPVHSEFREYIISLREDIRSDYIFHAIRDLNSSDVFWQTSLAKKTSLKHKMFHANTEIDPKMFTPYVQENSNDQVTDIMFNTEPHRSPSLVEWSTVVAKATMMIRLFMPTNDIGCRASYIAALLGTPYISNPSFIQSDLWPELVIDLTSTQDDIVSLIHKIKDNTTYRKGLVEKAFEAPELKVIENGGRDWTQMVDRIHQHAAYRKR